MNLSHFKTHDENYVVSCPNGCWTDGGDYPGKLCDLCGRAHLESHFTCAGCGERRNADEGGADDSLLGMACDHCVVATWGALAATAKAIALAEASR